MADELERIEEIRRRLGATGSRDVVIGIGDDAAVLAASDAAQVLTVDVAVDGVHFRSDALDAPDIGYRAAVAALSDLAAMGATPRAMLSSLILPAALSDAFVYALVDGIGRAAREYAAAVVGGNLARGETLSLTTTAVGAAPERVLTRAGARAGDTVWVTGTLGACALAVLARERGARAPDAVDVRYRRPRACIEAGRALAAVATAAIDVSDGLLQDLGHICAASNVAANLQAEALPIDPAMRAFADELGQDARALALGGGEDYELLFTLPPAMQPPVAATRIGDLVAGRGIRLLDAAGVELPLPTMRGFRHFDDAAS
jgi:thiamine-monophosphate kinase